MSGHASVVPFQFFRTADGYIAIAAAKERFFRDLVVAIDLPELAADERFADMAGRARHRAELLPILETRFRELDSDTWVERLRGVVPISRVRTMEEALDTDELRRRAMLAEYEHPVLGRVRSIAAPVTVAGYAPEHCPGPGLGADMPAILAELGYDDAARARLRAGGAFGASEGQGAGDQGSLDRLR